MSGFGLRGGSALGPLRLCAIHFSRAEPQRPQRIEHESGYWRLGGFDENYYATEDVVFVAALKRRGRFVILAESVITSGRKFREHSFPSIARLFIHLVLHRSRALQSRQGLEYWYEPKREKTKL